MNSISLKTAFLIIFFANIALAKVDTLMLSKTNGSVALYDFSEVYITDLSEDLASVRKNKNWKTLQKNSKLPQKKHLWIRFVLQNPSDITQRYFIRNPDNELTTYYIFQNNKLISELKNGEFLPTWGMDDNQIVGVNSFEVASKKTVEIYIDASNYQGFLPFLRFLPQKNIKTTYYLKTEQEYQKWLNTYYAHNLKELQVRVFYQGGLGIIFIIILFIFYQNRQQKLYKYYLIYIFSALIFTFLKSRAFTYFGKLAGILPALKTHGPEVFIWFGFAAYLLFVAELLNIKQQSTKFFDFIKSITKIFIWYAVTLFIWLVLTNDSGLGNWLFIYTRIPLLVTNLVVLFLAIMTLKSPLLKYVLWSNVLLFVFGIVAWLKVGFFQQQTWPGILNHIFTLPFAIMLECIVFALAISHKINADQLIKTQLEKKAIELENKALRSQMNPHFIFNSLNSVRYFVLSDQKEKAKEYLSKFSKLLRTILNYSKENVISLKDELEVIRLYIDVELGRFESNFKYTIDIADEIEADYISIPPLLLQPYIENAILHGLRNSEKQERMLKIIVLKKNEDLLEILIEDNGIGRPKAGEIKKEVLHQSFGTSITNQRIALFNQNFKSKISVETIDLPNDGGTQVSILINI